VIAGSLSFLLAGLGQRNCGNRRKVKEGNPIKTPLGCITYIEVGFGKLVWEALMNSPYQ
jgi:hypothetical protein